MEPVNEFLLSSRIVSLVALLMEVGILPVSLLKNKVSSSRLGSEAPMFGGRGPEKRFCWRCNPFNVERLNMEDGMEPFK